jgi:NAD(P)-dependent dehydrogenase (short-subunit alcohol dehydrogenase family)
MEKSFKVNTFGHVHVTSSLLPWIAAGNAPASPARIVNMSARVGSIEDNSLGGWYSYRMSKAALNQFTKTLAIELKRTNTVVLSLHPGTTDTTLSKPFQKNVKEGKLFTPEHAVSMMLEVVLTRGMAHTGGFFDYAGLPIAW